jgi:hypothetical protein
MSFKKEFEECIENIRAIEVSFQIAKEMEELLPSFFSNNLSRLKQINKTLKQVKRKQSGILFFLNKHRERKTEIVNSVTVRLNPNKTANKEQSYDIRAYLTLNDRFRIQKDLFNDDVEFMERIINQLNTLRTLSEAENYLDGMFEWDWESESAGLFKEILEKHFT